MAHEPRMAPSRLVTYLSIRKASLSIDISCPSHPNIPQVVHVEWAGRECKGTLGLRGSLRLEGESEVYK